MSWKPISKAYVFIELEGGCLPLGSLEKLEKGFLFSYSEEWLKREDAFAIDPVNLPLKKGEFESRRCWGVFTDAGPEAWGKKVSKATRQQAPANEIEWLLASKGSGVGALVFSTSRKAPRARSGKPLLAEISEEMVKALKVIQAGEMDRIALITEEIKNHLSSCSGMGGARPKFTAMYDGKEWLCKISRSGDTFSQPLAELASLNMAAVCGIRTSRAIAIKVDRQDVIMVQRFDRGITGNKKHYLSAFSMLHPERVKENDPESPISYLAIAYLIKKVSSDPQEDLRELFTRMMLNIALGNTDDHLRNHGFLYDGDDKYRLSPLFDVLPHPDQTYLMALNVGLEGRLASIRNGLSLSNRFGLSASEAKKIVDDVVNVTSRAKDFYLAQGMREDEVEMLSCVTETKIKEFS